MRLGAITNATPPVGGKAIITCADCGTSAPKAARGLCSRCYDRHRKAGTVSQFARTPRALDRYPAADEFASEKIRDEWSHFARLMGPKAAARRLAQVYGVNEDYALRVGEGTTR